MNEFTRCQKVILYCFGLLNELSMSGFLAEGCLRASTEGLNEFKKLKEEGFEPTAEEIEDAMFVIQSACQENNEG